jgi:hypothetical protein
MVAHATECPPETVSAPIEETADLFAPVSLVGQVRSQPELDKITAVLLTLPQAPHEMKHSFAPGIYLREIKMFKGTVLIGYQHKTEHFNVVLSGRASVYMDGKVHQIVAPCYFKSDCGVQKVLHIHEDMIWFTIHANPSNETCLEKLFDSIVVPNETVNSFREMLSANNLSRNLENYIPQKVEVVK